MRLHRIRSQAMLGGVCAGLGKYFSIDPTIVRLVFVVLAVFTGIGVLLYLALWFLLPVEDDPQSEMGYSSQEFGVRGQRFGKEVSDMFTRRRENTIRLVGIGLVVLGVVLFLRALIPDVFIWIDRINGPLFLIAMGAILLYLAFKGGRK